MSSPDPSHDRSWAPAPRLKPGLWVVLALLAGATPWLGVLVMQFRPF